MRAAIYARYSSDNQRPASIDDQVRRCREVIAARGWTEAASHADSEVSGVVTEGRPGYQQLLEGAKAGRFDVIVVDELSRLTRDPAELAKLRQRLFFREVGLVAVSEGLDTLAAPGAAAPVMMLRGMVNELELEANSHRSRRGLEGRILEGLHAGGQVYGYRTKPLHADRPGDPPGTGRVTGHTYLIQEEEAGVIRRIFQLYADGSSPRRIAAMLNAEGVPPPGSRRRRKDGVGRTWSCTSVAGNRRRGMGILNNEKYIGRIVWNRSTWPRDPDRDGRQVRREQPEDKWLSKDAPDLRIVPQELWDAVKRRQRTMARDTAGPLSHKRHRRLLSGLLVCGKCGARMVLRGTNTYSCASRQNRGSGICDSNTTVDARRAESALLDVLQRVLYSDRAILEVTKRVQQGYAARAKSKLDGDRRLAELRSRLTETQSQIDRLVDSIAQGVLMNSILGRAKELEARRDHLTAEIALAEGQSAAPALGMLPSVVKGYMGNVRRLLAEGEMERVKGMLGLLMDRVEVRPLAPAEGSRRPDSLLICRGNLPGALQLTAGRIKTGSSPGGIRTRDPMAENHVS